MKEREIDHYLSMVRIKVETFINNFENRGWISTPVLHRICHDRNVCLSNKENARILEVGLKDTVKKARYDKESVLSLVKTLHFFSFVFLTATIL